MLVSPNDPSADAAEPAPEAAGFTRRRLLARAGVAGVALGLGGLTLHQSSGYAAPAGDALRALSPKEFAVLLAAGEVILQGLDPELAHEAARWGDGYVARQSSWLRREVKALLHLFEHAPPLLGAGWSRATRLGLEARSAYLERWRASERALLRQGYGGLKSIVFMGAYRDPRAWAHCSYGGPPEHPLRGPR
ncbi:MAG: twin-arginine translocation signal domain-containing protein [Planctomycetes bacterium]|nr:twin-arginine translocation signal domain-containing protein [Planctomycetota bacterium]